MFYTKLVQLAILLFTILQTNIMQADDLNAEVQRWMIVNDTVMGGRSSADLYTLKDEPDVFRFLGQLSLENNGGFASVRAVFPSKHFAAAEHICIRVRGDGRRYQLRLRGGRSYDGVAFATSFETEENKWLDYRFAIKDFVPTWRGRQLSGIRDIRPHEVRQVTFMLADKKPGEFQLDFSVIRPCSDSNLI
jgi:monofunctional biosynthetic peptidoglycan transglycosylase